MIIVRERILDLALSKLAGLYQMSFDHRFARLFFEDLDGAHAILDQLVLHYVFDWSTEAQRELAIALEASLLFRKDQLAVNLTPSSWFLFPDPAEVFYGYVLQELGAHQITANLRDVEIHWDPGPIDDLILRYGPLHTHDWSKFV